MKNILKQKLNLRKEKMKIIDKDYNKFRKKIVKMLENSIKITKKYEKLSEVIEIEDETLKCVNNLTYFLEKYDLNKDEILKINIEIRLLFSKLFSIIKCKETERFK